MRLANEITHLFNILMGIIYGEQLKIIIGGLIYRWHDEQFCQSGIHFLST
ncbi:hypothetical protein XSR1_170031 [Xenorhabdus szentirmaii DSM 16338]|uniref:Uncharacterized protein n=1 Tax=Xenorhabdus szentirmaii DSM 16338 TaxID=1427518 RepID=W1ITW9_9GAMM|nr:hypothetical protein XSR1_170031 [Xenorhabdus szentirmaii DSM 16338]